VSEVDHYDYELPESLIAQQPLVRRSDARLMVVDRKTDEISHRYIRDLPELLERNDCLVVNDTRVIPATLIGRRQSTSGRWQGLFLDSDSSGLWRILCKTRGKQAPGDVVMLLDGEMRDRVALRLLERRDEGEWIAKPESDAEAHDILEMVGRVPLPHYIRKGAMRDEDRQSYQTVYAARDGAVAAPTAGLHFTVELLKKLKERGVVLARVTLHVGAGTFRPIKSDTLAGHAMHSEWGSLEDTEVERIEAARAAGGRVIAVGTTSMRVLETAAADGNLREWSGMTDLFVKPGFKFHAVDALLTNFHLPRSTLLVLVRTFGGDRLMRRAYEEAIAEQYRFYSYGDAMLVL
jgi:S-adenosylmethionine:tRNA ribosyltransferase-isomerase